MNTNEQDLRREAIRRRLNGERRKDICRDLERSTQWFDKWWSIFDHDPHTDFSDRSRAPVAPHLTVVTLPLPLLVAVSAWVDVLGAWMQPKGAGGP
jgi:hypothetical protein